MLTPEKKMSDLNRERKKVRKKLLLQKKKLLNYLIKHVEKLENISPRDDL